MAMYGSPWYGTLYGSVWQCMVYGNLYGSLWQGMLYGTLYDSIWQCMVWQCMAVYGTLYVVYGSAWYGTLTPGTFPRQTRRLHTESCHESPPSAAG
jgi:hypothetical protein